MGTLGTTVDAPFGAPLAGGFETPLVLVVVVAIVETRSISDALTPMNVGGMRRLGDPRGRTVRISRLRVSPWALV